MKRLLLLGLSFGLAVTSWAQLSWGVGIGQTYYDLHSNSTTGNRLIKNADGSMSATWIEHWDVLNPDNTPKGNVRGFGYNHFVAGSGWAYGEVTAGTYYTGECWTDQYGCASQYVGWPEMINLASANGNGNQEVIINHTPMKITQRPVIGGAPDANGSATSNWTNTALTNAEQDLGMGTWDGTWPRAVASDGYIHSVITSTDLNGFFDNTGVEMPCVYIRSSDGGVTWDTPMEWDVDSLLPDTTLIPTVTYDTTGMSTNVTQVLDSIWEDTIYAGTFTVGGVMFNADSAFARDTITIEIDSTDMDTIVDVSSIDDTAAALLYVSYYNVLDTVYAIDTINGFDSIFGTSNQLLVNQVGADAYQIAANGSTVAVTFGAGIDNDWLMFKSTDNGTTWSRTVIKRNHYLDTAVIDGSGGWGAIANLDNFDIIVDNNGMVHVASGMGFPSNGGGVYLMGADDYFTGGPGWQESLGILYWNENMTDPEVVAYPDYGSDGNANDYNSNGTEFYGFVWQGWPSLSYDDNGGIQLIYSAIAEDQGADFITVNGDTLGYNDLYMVYSTDNGATWCQTNDPINIAADVYGQFGGTPTQDDLYPVSVADATGGTLHFTWQGDYSRPGVALYDDTHPNDILNYIHYANMDISTLTSCAVVPEPCDPTDPAGDCYVDAIGEINAAIEFAMVPNPAKDNFTVSANTSINNVTVVNMFGQTVKNITTNSTKAYTVNVSDLAEGMYIVNVATAQGTATEKLNIIK